MKRRAVVLQGSLEIIETDGGRLPPAVLIGKEDLGDEIERLCKLDKLELSRGVDGVAPGKWILTLVRYACVASVALGLVGCAMAQEKGRIYRDVAERFVVPDKVVVCYERDGDVQTGYEARCFGPGCELPDCPGDE